MSELKIKRRRKTVVLITASVKSLMRSDEMGAEWVIQRGAMGGTQYCSKKKEVT